MTFLRRKTVIHTIAVITILYVIYYIWWRVADTLNPTAPLLSILLLAAELLGIIEFFLFSFMTWDTDQEKETLAPLKDVLVDVFVPTYNEDIKILMSTLVGCNNMRYRHTTYVLDDGRREEVKELARLLGCGYLTRENNKYAKAGNINEALKKTSGEFIVILDADMVPQPDFIEKTLGYFRDGKTAIVQLPQEFYNLDSAQHQAADWHEQQLFYHVIQIGKNRLNSSFWCGSPSIVRREAVESIGGVAAESITEDFLSSIKLNSRGWKIKYHHEVLAFGIAPQSVYAFNLQRLRWAQGSMKILKSKYNPLVAPNLTIQQRLSHFSAIFTYFSSYQKLIYLLIPSLYLLTGILPVKVTNGLSFLLHWIPYFGLTMLSNTALARGYFRYFEVEKYNTIKLFIFIRASFTLFLSKNLKFQVTPKTIEETARQKERKELKKQLILLIFILISVLWGGVNSLWKVFFLYPSMESAVAAIFWALFNSVIIGVTLYDVFRRMFNRRDYRFPFRMTAKAILKGSEYLLPIEDISLGGLSIAAPDDLSGSVGQDIRICFPDGNLILAGEISYIRLDRSRNKKIGVKFYDLSLEEKILLNELLYITVPRYLHDNKTSCFDYTQNSGNLLAAHEQYSAF